MRRARYTSFLSVSLEAFYFWLTNVFGGGGEVKGVVDKAKFYITFIVFFGICVGA